jgi:long-subunit fatty acid transport protein
VEGKYEGWSAFNQIILNGTQVTIKSPTLCSQSPIGPDGHPTCTQNVGIQSTAENWKDAWGGRIGGSYKVLTEAANGIGLKVHLGALYETNAVPSEYQTLQAVTGNRFAGSAGVTLSYYGFGLTLAAMGYVPVSLTITDSKVDRGVSGIGPGQSDLYPVYIGNGTYTASYWVASIGLSYTGGT